MFYGERGQQPDPKDLPDAAIYVARAQEIEGSLAEIANEQEILRSQIVRLNTQLHPLRAQYRTLKARRLALERERNAYQALFAARAASEATEARTKAMTSRLTQDAEQLAHVDNGLLQSFGRVLTAMAQDPRFTNALPELQETDLSQFSTTTPNTHRIRIATEKDSLRMVLFKGHGYALVYNPKPNQPQIADYVAHALGSTSRTGHSVNEYVFGVAIDPDRGMARPFGVDLNMAKPVGVYIPENRETIDIDPIMNYIVTIVATGDISLPKSFGEVTIKRGQQTQ